MTYLGYDVIEVNFNRLGAIEERSRRKFVLLDPGTGKRLSDAHAPAPAGARPFIWTARTRAESAAMRDFIDARKGRAIPFWLPSYQWDLRLAEDAVTDQAILSIEWVRYTEQMWGTTGARRHLAIFELGQEDMDYYQISAASDPGDDVTESITIDPTAVRDYPKASTVISFLKLCRLATDEIEISYPDGKHATAAFPVIELPLEAPA